jgi:CubicO group peptidase (beta-lactamase class C family)
MKSVLFQFAAAGAFACGLVPAVIAQSTPTYPQALTVSAETAQHIEHVENGLIGGIVLKTDAHPAHTLADRMKELSVPGVSIAVIHHGEIEWARGFGVSGVSGQPVTTDTMFQAGSISKPLAAMAVLRLAQLGRLSLDADVNTLLTSWKLPADAAAAGKPVTIRALLTHTAGITVHGFPGYVSTAPVPTLLQVLNGEKPANTPAIRIESAPGSRWNYSGGGYTIVQQAVVDMTKEPFPKLLHDTVLAQIGMKHSTYEQPLPKEFEAAAAAPFHETGKPVESGAHTYPEMAAAGLWTTPTDLALYAIEVEKSLQGKANHVLSVEMTKQMLTAGMGNWGLGLEIGGAEANPYFSHGGANEGFRNMLVAYEKTGEGAIVMTNGDNGSALADEIIHSIAAEYAWPDFRPTIRESISVDPKVLSTYTGTYELQPGFDLVVTVENGQLITQATGQGKVPIFAKSQTTFFPIVIDAEIEFASDSQGNLVGLVLHQGGHEMKAKRKGPIAPVK